MRPVRHALVLLAAVLIASVLSGGAAAAGSQAYWTARAQAAFEKLPLAPTPPMGWNSWNNFHCDIDEDLIRQTADAMVESGMREAGYEYVNIDDCWMAPERDADGNLQADPERFPSGIKALADYVHERGLKLGIYSSAGTATCQGLPASLDHEEADAQKFAEWEVDLLKYDNCNNQNRPAIERYTVMAEALAATGREIVYSICEWGSNQPWEWAGELGHYWRTTGDIADNWGSMVSILDQQVGLEEFAGPNAWNDPDMLEVGNGGMTTEEYRSHMSLWALLNSPLLAGNDLRSMDDTTVELLTDPDVIAINQDWGGIQGRKIADEGDAEVWTKPMSDGGAAVVLFNRGPVGAQVSTTAERLGLPDRAAYTLRDAWSDEVTVSRGDVRASVPSHGSRTFVVEPGVPAGREPAVSLHVPTDTEGFVEAGQTFTATVEIANDGFTPIGDVDMSLTAPAGWSAEPTGPTQVRTVPPGQTASVMYSVTVPPDVEDDVFELPASAEYRTVGADPADRELAGYGSIISATAPRGGRWLSDLDPIVTNVGFGSMGIDESVDGNPIRIGGVTYDKGISPHAPSEVTYYLGRNCTRFTADVGIDDETSNRGSVTFTVLGDRAELVTTDVITGGEPAQSLDVDVSGVLVLTLITDTGPDNNNYDHSNWAAPRLQCDGPSTAVTAAPTDVVTVNAGDSVEVSGTATANGTEPALDVVFGPQPPAGWTVGGDPVQAATLEPGETLEGSWTVTVPPDAELGPVDLPVTTTYRAADDEVPFEDSAVVRLQVQPAGVVAVREAEAGTNTISGATRISNCGACSGGQKVGFLGNGADNYLTVDDIEVDTAGEYDLVIDYLVSGTRPMFVSVNGGAGVELSLSGTSFATPVTTRMRVELQAGANDIRFYNDTAFGPDLDRFMIAEVS